MLPFMLIYHTFRKKYFEPYIIRNYQICVIRGDSNEKNSVSNLKTKDRLGFLSVEKF